MIKICSEPVISEHTDRWSQSTGEKYVHHVSGYVEKEYWEFINKFQNINEQKWNEEYEALLKRAGSRVLQFNLREADGPNYIRSYVVMGESSFKEWSPEHDGKVKKLEEEIKHGQP